MQTPVEIDFQGLKGNEKLRACVLKHIAVLEQRFGRITACRVVIKAPSERHRTVGKLTSAAPKRPTIVTPTQSWR